MGVPMLSIYSYLAEPHYGRGKRIKFWKNGDIYSHCYEVYINPNKHRSWNSILEFLSSYINPEFGAVRKVFNLKTGKSVCCFDNLNPDEKYVVAGKQSKLQNVKNGYHTSSEIELKLKCDRKKLYSADFDPVKFKFLEETSKRRLTIIFLLVSGRPCQKAVKIVLREADIIRWGNTMNYLAKMTDVPDGIHSLCTVFGDIIPTPDDLQHGCVYVAVPFGQKFKELDYAGLLDKRGVKGSHVMELNFHPYLNQLQRGYNNNSICLKNASQLIKRMKNKNGNDAFTKSCSCMTDVSYLRDRSKLLASGTVIPESPETFVYNITTNSMNNGLENASAESDGLNNKDVHSYTENIRPSASANKHMKRSGTRISQSNNTKEASTSNSRRSNLNGTLSRLSAHPSTSLQNRVNSPNINTLSDIAEESRETLVAHTPTNSEKYIKEEVPSSDLRRLSRHTSLNCSCGPCDNSSICLGNKLKSLVIGALSDILGENSDPIVNLEKDIKNEIFSGQGSRITQSGPIKSNVPLTNEEQNEFSTNDEIVQTTQSLLNDYKSESKTSEVPKMNQEVLEKETTGDSSKVEGTIHGSKLYNRESSQKSNKLYKDSSHNQKNENKDNINKLTKQSLLDDQGLEDDLKNVSSNSETCISKHNFPSIHITNCTKIHFYGCSQEHQSITELKGVDKSTSVKFTTAEDIYEKTNEIDSVSRSFSSISGDSIEVNN